MQFLTLLIFLLFKQLWHHNKESGCYEQSFSQHLRYDGSSYLLPLDEYLLQIVELSFGSSLFAAAGRGVLCYSPRYHFLWRWHCVSIAGMVVTNSFILLLRASKMPRTTISDKFQRDRLNFWTF